MQKITLLGILVLSAMLFGLPRTALAHDGATVITDQGCFVSAIDSGIGRPLFSEDSHIVHTPSGNIILQCHIDLEDEGLFPEKTFKNRFFQCAITIPDVDTFITTDTQLVVNKRGKAHLTCMY